MEQIQFSFANNDNFNKEEFILSKCNEEAYNWLATWPNKNMSQNMLILYGNRGAGKSHLANIWQNKNFAISIYSEQFEKIISEDLLKEQRSYLCEDIDKINDEVTFFNFLNYSRRKKSIILFTCNMSPKSVQYKLPDLESRILAINSIKINDPDEDMLKMLLIKLFSDRQLRISKEVIDYIINHSNRSVLDLYHIVTQIDTQSMQDHRNITIPFIKKILAS